MTQQKLIDFDKVEALKTQLFLILIAISVSTFGQTNDNPIYLNKNTIRKVPIREIKEFYRRENIIDTNNYNTYQFDSGALELEFSTYWTTQYYYNYSDSIKNQLSTRNGNGAMGNAQQNYFKNYEYYKGRMISSTSGSEYSQGTDSKGQYVSEISNDEMERFFYYPDDRLNYSINYTIETDTTESSRRYYIYNEKQLVGYYPAKDYDNQNDWDKSDTIYNEDKIKSLKKEGFESFSKKYFKEELLQKVINDCYEPFVSKQLFINGKPIKEFLATIGITHIKYLIIEIADNNFKFYKIID